MKATTATAALVLLLTLGAAAPALAQPRPLDVRVNDMATTPGGRIAVVLRTYESRPIGQGQVCLRISGRAFNRGESALVTSGNGDAIHRVQQVDAQTFLLQFSSPSGSINEIEGPFAVLYFRARGILSPGQRFSVSIDLRNSFLIDALGEPILINPDPGVLMIRSPSAPMEVEAQGDRIFPGQAAAVYMQTREAVPLTSGSMGLRYDPTVTIGPPVVHISETYGNVEFLVDTSVPGLVLVTFESPDASFGRIPGELIKVELGTLSDVLPGTLSPVTLDPSLTVLVGSDGSLPILLHPGEIEFR